MLRHGFAGSVTGALALGLTLAHAQTPPVRVSVEAPGAVAPAVTNAVVTPKPVLAPRPDVERQPSGEAKTWFAEEQESWLTGHLELGLRVSQNKLDTTTDTDGSFIGTIDELKVEDDLTPYNVVVAVNLNRWFGMEGQWDQVEAKTFTDTEDNHSDGSFIADGPCLAFCLRWPATRYLTPYVEGGWAFLKADFDEEAWWALGYASPDDYVQDGSPSESPNGKTRDFVVENEKGTLLAFGAMVRLYHAWWLDFQVRQVDLDADVHYTISVDDNVIDDRGVTTIPLSYTATSLGVRYAF